MAMTTMRGAEAVVRTLEEYDTELVVGYIGHTTQEIADAITYSSNIRAIQPVTELGGAHIINAYNFLRGRSTVNSNWHTCGTMLMTGPVYESLVSRIPSVHPGLNADGSYTDREAIQDMPNQQIFGPLTRFTTRVERPD